MIIGIVGSELSKFGKNAVDAINIIHGLVAIADGVASGKCHLRGVDEWAEIAAYEQGKNFYGFPPKTRNWEGYKARNIQIAEASDRVVCITVKTLPPGFREGGWERYCYHCKTGDHIKSGGCWTVKYAREKLGKQGEIIVV